jgi:hypothetical protein
LTDSVCDYYIEQQKSKHFLMQHRGSLLDVDGENGATRAEYFLVSTNAKPKGKIGSPFGLCSHTCLHIEARMCVGIIVGDVIGAPRRLRFHSH